LVQAIKKIMAAYQKKNSTVAETTTTQVAPISRAVVD
jgi:hypothetical protein